MSNQTIDGVPVVWIKPDVAKTLTKDECCYAFGSQNPKGTLIPLYAAHPAPVAVKDYQNKINHLKQLLRNVRVTLHFSPEDVLAIDAALREDE